MRSFFKRDHLLLGIGLGLIIPVVFYFIIGFLADVFTSKNAPALQESTIQLLAIVVNLLPFRYYLVKLKADKTGRGVLLATFLYALVYFYFNWAE